jgi:hypothetical protein
MRRRVIIASIALLVPLLSLTPSPRTSGASAPSQHHQTIAIDHAEVDPELSDFCGFGVEVHEVGTAQLITFPDGHVQLNQKETATFTASGLGTSFKVFNSLQINELNAAEVFVGELKEVTLTTIYAGLNYRTSSTSKPFVSSGRGVTEVTFVYDEFGDLIDVDVDETFSSNLEHLTAVVCQALSGVGFGRASISGTVRDAQTGAALGDVCVVAFDATTGEFARFALTDPTGRYQIGLLKEGGRYQVLFTACSDGLHADQWWRGRTDIDDADVVTLRQRATKGIDASLSPMGIGGTVTSEATGAPLEDICVLLVDSDGFIDEAVVTASDGTYRMGAPFDGDFLVFFEDCGFPTVYASEWWNDQPTPATADTVTFAPGSFQQVDAALAVGGAISGRIVDDATGSPIADLCVQAFSAQGQAVGFAISDADGAYRIGGLPAGQTAVDFEGCLGDTRYGPEWWDDVAVAGPFLFSNRDPLKDGADLVDVALAEETSGIDAGLSPQGVAGTVTDAATGDPIAGACVTVWTPVLPEGDVEVQEGIVTTTDSDGTWRVRAVPIGDFYVEFNGCDNPYLTQWFDGKEDFSVADPVTVTRNTMTSGVDAQLERGGVVAGAVTDVDSGQPLGDICVEAWRTGESEPQGSAGFDVTTDAGTYEIQGLGSHDYAMQFYDCGDRANPYAEEWYDDRADYFTATPVPATAGARVDGIDAALEIGGHLRGTITEAATGDPLPFTCVSVYTPAGWRVFFDQVGSDGTYDAGGLQTGDYTVFFENDPFNACGSRDDLLSEWYRDRPDRASADLVHVTSGQVVTQIDGDLVVGG